MCLTSKPLVALQHSTHTICIYTCLTFPPCVPAPQGIYGREMYETWYKMSSMLVGGLQERLQPIITHRYPLKDFQKGFDVMCAGESGKVILEF